MGFILYSVWFQWLSIVDNLGAGGNNRAVGLIPARATSIS